MVAAGAHAIAALLRHRYAAYKEPCPLALRWQSVQGMELRSFGDAGSLDTKSWAWALFCALCARHENCSMAQVEGHVQSKYRSEGSVRNMTST